MISPPLVPRRTLAHWVCSGKTAMTFESSDYSTLKMKINLKLFWKWSCFAKSLLSFQSCPWELHFRFMLSKNSTTVDKSSGLIDKYCLATVSYRKTGQYIWLLKDIIEINKKNLFIIHFTHFMYCRNHFLCFLLSFRLFFTKLEINK